MRPTDTSNPDYFHKVVDCQWGCPAHTDVPEYIRMIAQARFSDAYMLNRVSNVFPAILGRVCDRPCEPVCRRGRVEDKPVAICRLKRVASDNRGDITDRLPKAGPKNGKRIACIGAGCASLTVANDLLPLGYEIVIFEKLDCTGGLMRSNIPAFRLPVGVLDEEINYIVDIGVDLRLNSPIDSMKNTVEGKLRRDLCRHRRAARQGTKPSRADTTAIIFTLASTGSNRWLSGTRNEDRQAGIDHRCRKYGDGLLPYVVAAWALTRSASWRVSHADFSKRLTGSSMMPRRRMSRSLLTHSPKEFVMENGKLVGMNFDLMEYDIDDNGRIQEHQSTVGEQFLPCDDVILAIGQENSFPWIERDIGLEFDQWDVPLVDKTTYQSTLDGVFFGGDAAFGPENIIWAVEHGHQASISIHKHCHGESLTDRLPYGMNLSSAKMGIHEWSYSNDYDVKERRLMPHVSLKERFKKLNIEVELGFSAEQAATEVERCLNCDIQTVFVPIICASNATPALMSVRLTA